jgi:hypothetical protein
MKYCGGISLKLVFVSVALVLASCVSVTPVGAPISGGTTVDAGYYTVKSPPEKGWGVQVDKEKGIVKFQKVKWWRTFNLLKFVSGTLASDTGEKVGSTVIQIFRNGITEGRGPITEKKVADDFRNNEERIMMEKGVKTGFYKLIGNIVKDSTTVDGRKLYSMIYAVKLSGQHRQEVAFYLYFPPDFKEKHIFYGFLINEAYRPTYIEADLEQIFPVIKSFEMKTSKLTEKEENDEAQQK